MTGIYILELKYAASSSSSSSSAAAPSSAAQGNSTLTSVFATAATHATLKTRTGFFGMCAQGDGAIWICSSDGPALLAQFGAHKDPLNLIWITHQFQSTVVFSGFMYVPPHPVPQASGTGSKKI